jgi:hypothetical protein
VTALYFALSMQQTMSAVLVHDFSMMDVYNPDTRRTVRNLSAIINFLKFREEHLDTFRELYELSEQLHVANQQQQEENAALKERRAELRAKQDPGSAMLNPESAQEGIPPEPEPEPPEPEPEPELETLDKIQISSIFRWGVRQQQRAKQQQEDAEDEGAGLLLLERIGMSSISEILGTGELEQEDWEEWCGRAGADHTIGLTVGIHSPSTVLYCTVLYLLDLE